MGVVVRWKNLESRTSKDILHTSCTSRSIEARNSKFERMEGRIVRFKKIFSKRINSEGSGRFLFDFAELENLLFQSREIPNGHIFPHGTKFSKRDRIRHFRAIK